MPRSPRPWFRFYVEAVHDRKLRRQKPETRWLFVACLAAARQSPEPGWLMVGWDDPMGWDDVVDFAAMPLRSVEHGMDALQDAGVLGFDQERKAWFVPNWDDRQFESDDVTKRTAKHRSKERSNTVVGTPSESETETESETSSSPPPFPDSTWQALAKKKLNGAAANNPAAWCRKVAANDRAEFGERAAWIWSTYEISESQLVDVLAAGGQSPLLNSLRKRETA